MDSQIQMGIVYVIVLTTTFLTWKMIKDFYAPKFHKVFTHLIAVITASFMFLSSMSLFVPRNYQRGATAEVELSFLSIAIIIVMLAVIFYFFRYLPNKNK